ncbi:MAG: hypothetical protein IPH57_15340 [Saprospiraceae bacterium]|nr:hypothetical protein [Saprospiraceae bacterium]
MKKMKIKNGILAFFVLLTINISAVSQNLNELKRDTTINMFDLFFYVEKDNIYEFYSNSGGDNFFKVIILPEYGHGLEDFIGEALDHAYLLKGEYKDYPLGNLFDLGLFYNILDCKIQDSELVIKYFSKSNPKLKKIKLP